MRFYGIALLAGAAALGACGGEAKSSTDTAAASAAATSTATPSTATATPSTGTAPAAGAVAAAPATGTTHEVKMIGDATGYKFDPANITVKSGDAIKYIMVSGGPHNVAFIDTPAAAKSQLMANMPNQMKELTSPMMMNPNENYTISFANVAPGTYNYHCEPHAAMGMKGTITVQ